MTQLVNILLSDPIGRWFLYFGVAVGIAIAAAVFARTALKRLDRLGADLGIVRHEVKNDHSTNLRVEADQRHDENARKLDWLIQAVTRLQGDVQNLYTNDTQSRAQLEELERTIDRRPNP